MQVNYHTSKQFNNLLLIKVFYIEQCNIYSRDLQQNVFIDRTALLTVPINGRRREGKVGSAPPDAALATIEKFD